MKLKLYFYAFDHNVSLDGAVDKDNIYCNTYQPDDRVALGTTEVDFTPPPPGVIIQGKIDGLESALDAYRKESLEHIERLQGKISELKALPGVAA